VSRGTQPFNRDALSAMSSDLRDQSTSGAVLVFLGAVGFSVKAIFIKLAYRYAVDATTLLALRMTFALPFFLAVAWKTGSSQGSTPLGRREW